MRYLTFRDRIKEKKRIRTLLESGQPLTPNDMELLANLTSNPRDLFVNMSTGCVISSGPQDGGNEQDGSTATSQDPSPSEPAPIFNPDNYTNLDPNASDAGESTAALAQLQNFPPELLAHLTSVLRSTADDPSQTEAGEDRSTAQQQQPQVQAQQQQTRPQGAAQPKASRGRRGQQAAQNKPGQNEAIEALLRLRGEDEGEAVPSEPLDAVGRSDRDEQTAPPLPPEAAEASTNPQEKRSGRSAKRKD